MRARFRLTSASLLFPLLASVGLAAGCGDNAPNLSDGGAAGSVGQTGTGGAAGRGATGTGGAAGAGAAGSGGAAGAGAAGTGGAAGAGAAGTGGAAGAGVAGTGGHAGTGGAAGAGVAGTGGHAGTGGTAGTGVAGTNGTAGTNGVAGTNGTAGTSGAVAPTCTISAPTITATHPDLNGVAAPAGDRTSSIGSNYQATFVVDTNAEDGQPVSLAVDNTTAPTTITTFNQTASGGKATFGVTLTPDGTYQVFASCTNKAGVTGTSTKGTYPVDTTAPDLTVNSPTSGQFFGPSALDGNGAFQVCAQTDSTDAAGLSSTLGAAQQNLCVGVGNSTACTAVAAINSSTCLSVVCPGSAPFNLGITLKDAAGNPTTQTLTGITCASTLPSVQIISPLSDSGTFSDKTKHILAATAPVGVLDLDSTTPGAQANVVACTDTAGTATLLAGQVGAALTQLGGAVAEAVAVPADNCPAGLGFVVRFNDVTLPESTEDGNGALVSATELKVFVTATANALIGSSAAVNVWVDSLPPALTLTTPPSLCGSFTQSATTVTEDVLFSADDALVRLQVTNGPSTTIYDIPSFLAGVATFSNVAFTEGQNNLTATETDPAGNQTNLTPVPCSVTLGAAPVVTFTTPTAGAILCPAGAIASGCIDDTDPATPGWQGNLAVTVVASTVPVVGSSITFSVGGSSLGSALTDSTGTAQIVGVTLPDGVETITATTDNIPGAGVGSGTVLVTVDTGAPNAPTGIAATIVDRRKTSMQVTWTAPSDSIGNAVAGYQVRYAKVPITAANFNDSTVTTAVTFAGTPGAPGQVDGLTVSGLYIENGYYFAVEAINNVGSVGAIDATSVAVTAHFNIATIPSTSGTNEEIGYALDGSGDVNGDGISDVIAGTFEGGRAYLYLGATPTFAPTAASTVLSGASPGFGNGVAMIGDIDKDGFEDIAITDVDTFDATSTGKIYVFKGRAVWPATLTDTQADYVITPDSTYAATNFGLSITRLGDFDGDGVDDFAFGASAYASHVGRVVIVRGKVGGIGNINLPDATNTIVIGGDPTLTRSIFGYRVLGLGHFYSVTTGTTLIVSAPGTSNGTNPDNEGRVYAFHGQSGTAGVISISSADAEIIGPGKPARIGVELANLGPVVNSLPSVGIGNPADAVSVPGITGTMFITSGSVATGPFASKVIVTQSGGAAGGGNVVFGGGISGRNTSYSLIGSSAADVAIVAGATAKTISIMDGATLGGASSFDFASTAQVQAPLPVGWPATSEAGGGLVPDINGDGYPDFTVSDSATAIPGEVLVYW